MDHPRFDLILYHGNCPDGFTSAWVFWLTHKYTCEYVPCQYGQKPPDITGKKVAIVDFSFSKDILIKMAQEANFILLLDHHKSAKDDLCDLKLDNVQIIFDMDRCGAQLAWDYVFRRCKARDWYIEYVADRDLWKHQLPNTLEISCALWYKGYFSDFEKLEQLYESSTPTADQVNLAEEGKRILEYKDSECNQYASNSVPTIFQGYRVNLAGCPRQYRSDVGNIICSTQECDFAAVYWYDFASKEWWISLRASENSGHDLSRITSQLPSGGGHPKAAGFKIYGSKHESLDTYFLSLGKN